MCGSIFVAAVTGPVRADIIEDFESGPPALAGYPDQDHDPDDWQLITSNAYGGSGHSLRLYGNTWKTQAIAPVAVADSTVWQVAIYCENRGEMQALGVSDGTNELFYTFFGEDLPQNTNWFTVYQGAFPRNEWHLYLLPIGRDWETRFGYLPDLDGLVYVNDADSGPAAITLFDAIVDVTTDLPRAPRARILYTVAEQKKVGEKLYQLVIDFLGEVFDPDSQDHSWAWDFGDSTTSDLQNPQHEFLVHADYPYTVGLRVTDPDGLAAGDTCQITVHPGDPAEPLTVNFVGDVFTGRGYENNGGIIDTYGIEALFEPTLDIFGRAADVNVANLEVPYTDRGTPHPTKSVVFRSRPENITGIAYAGIDVVTLGNNHIIDYGEIGMLDTMDGLDELNIRYSGAGSSDYLALLPTFWTEKGVRLGFLGLCNRTGRQWNYQPFLDAGFDKPGFGHLLPEQLARSIDYTRPLSDIVIVQTHSGDEYETAPPPGLKLGGGHPRVEVAEIHADDPDFQFKVEPSPGERELRRMALDLGADVLINHHPHVLQGFEAHDGKLIAHSLGNFIFDLYYTETMPTMVLTLEIEKTGITGYRFTPAWINHWIPEPATGNLGREIVGRLADYSRSMNAIVVPIPDSDEARIHLSRAELDSTVLTTEATLPLNSDGTFAVSAPLALTGQGFLSQVKGMAGGGPWEVRWGREILWHGGFEDEGADLWDVNTDDEDLVNDVAHGGQRSLRLRRSSGDVGQTGTDLEKHLPCDPTKQHSATAWLRAENAEQARVMVRYYGSRYSETPVGDYDLAPRFDGTTEWIRQWRDLDTPSDGVYFEMRCGQEPPSSGTGFSWFDDLAFIEWERWVDVDTDVEIAAPNNYRFLQIRSADSGATTIDISYGETAYGPRQLSDSHPDIPEAQGIGLNCYPNPFNPRVTIELEMRTTPAAGVTIDVFDLRGRKVRTLHTGPLPVGIRNGLTWDGNDDRGRALASGVYLVQARVGEQKAERKVTLLR
jgi:poly-gamma-glutamate capsule biosynthesis protein CapA/YwtB (metallophosphatase superfamily)